MRVGGWVALMLTIAFLTYLYSWDEPQEKGRGR